MSNWQKVKIGDYLEKINIKGSEISNFSELEALGVSNIDGITKTSHVKSNDLSNYLYIEEDYFAYNPYRINVGSIGLTPKGIKGLVSPAYIVFKTTKYLLAEILFDFLKSKDGLFQINKLAKGTVRKTLSFEELCKIEMIIPPIEKQKEILQKQKGLKVFINDLNIEIENQQSFLKQLKQTILQEAIEGKLTENWREENQNIGTGKELLEEIKKEKAKLIKEKKIKAQKPLSPINDDEILFDIPSSWEWCRLGEILNTFLGGSAFNSSDLKDSGNCQVLRLGNVKQNNLLLDNKAVFINMKIAEENLSSELKLNDLLITMTGTRGKRDYCFTTLLKKNHFKKNRLFLNQRVGCFRFNSNVSILFFDFLLKNDILLDEIYKTATGSANQANIGSAALNSWVLPLPPLEEQKEIVSIIEKLFAICDELESEIKQNKITVDNLMATVLKEAFEE